MRRTLPASILVALALSLPSAIVRGETPEKDAYIFLSKGGDSKSFEFKKYSRVSFGDNAFILTPREASLDPVTLSYGDFCRLQFGHYEEGTGSVSLIPAAESLLRYDNGAVAITGADGDSFLITVYCADGTLLAKGYGRVDLSRLPMGVYMATATDGNTRHMLKFYK